MSQARPGEPGGAGRFGSTVAGRYRLDEPRPADLPGAERWSATDLILARPVTVTLVSGPRTTAVLDAARRASLVVDPRLVRILDVGSVDATGYVVTESVEGRSIAALAARAPLSPDQARAVVGEAAAALEAARRRGVHHLALRPEVVLLTSASRVVVDGLAVDGELLGGAGGGAHAMSRTDTVGLVRVLYAALTGRWPGAVVAQAGAGGVPTFDEWSSSAGRPATAGPAVDAVVPGAGLPDAPQHDGVPLPPADLVAGVPADLDTLCVVTLGPHDDGPHSPGELVRELEPWRAVRADEVFRAADAGRWHALPDQDGAGRPGPAPAAAAAAAVAVTGTSTADDGPATGERTSTDPAGRVAEDDGTRETTPGVPAVPGAGAGAGAGAAGIVAAAGAVAAGAGTAQVPGAAGTAAGATAAGAAGALPGVARQSVRSAFGAEGSAGSRRPGTPPPATYAPAAFPPPAGTSSGPTGTHPVTVTRTEGPGRTSGSSTSARSVEVPDTARTPATGSDSVPPAHPGGSSGATPPTAPEVENPAPAAALPPSIPPTSTSTTTRSGPEPTVHAETPGPVEPTAHAEPTVHTEPPEPPERAGETGPTDPIGLADSSGPAHDAPPSTVPAPRATPSTAPPASVVPVPTPHPDEEPPVETVRFDPIGSPPGDDDGSDRAGWDLPFPAEQPRQSLGQRRFDPSRWVLSLVAIAVVVGVVVAIGNVLRPFGSGDDQAAAPAPVVTATQPASEAPADQGGGDGGAAEVPATAPPVIAGVTSIDLSDGDGEHEELVGRLTDGDPATAWYTHTYNRPDFAGFKDGVGLAITLQAPATVTSITLDVNGTGGNVEVRSTDAANPTAGDVLASGPMNGQTVLTLSQPTETQSLVLWFTSLAQTPDGANKIEISNIAVG